MAGRPTVLTPELAEDVCRLVRLGAYVETAANLAGIAKATVYRWLHEADQPGAKPELVAFRDAYEKAAAESEFRAQSDCYAGDDGWQSKAWFLERRFRDRWRRDKPDDTQTQHAPPIINVQLPESDRVRKLEDALRKAGIEVPE